MEVYDHTGCKLNLKGIKKLWRSINKIVEKIDAGQIRPFREVYAEAQQQKMWVLEKGRLQNRFKH